MAINLQTRVDVIRITIYELCMKIHVHSRCGACMHRIKEELTAFIATEYQWNII
jgi:bacterioferritin-associated ferredoxin